MNFIGVESIPELIKKAEAEEREKTAGPIETVGGVAGGIVGGLADGPLPIGDVAGAMAGKAIGGKIEDALGMGDDESSDEGETEDTE